MVGDGKACTLIRRARLIASLGGGVSWRRRNLTAVGKVRFHVLAKTFENVRFDACYLVRLYPPAHEGLGARALFESRATVYPIPIPSVGQHTRMRPIVIAPLLLFSALVSGAALAHDNQGATSPKTSHVVDQQKTFGIGGNSRDVERTIDMRMRDEMRFIPGHLDVRQGETIRLKLANDGKLQHELVIGTRKELEAHAAMMMKSGMTHDEPYVAHVAPGETGEIIWKFNRAGRFHFACLVAGHYQAGMAGTITVTSR